MLDYVMDHDWFISLSFLLRITESIGSTGALVAAFSITAAVFPKAIGTTFVSDDILNSFHCCISSHRFKLNSVSISKVQFYWMNNVSVYHIFLNGGLRLTVSTHATTNNHRNLHKKKLTSLSINYF